jgi:ABC-type cobalamin/Fe3+-siderophores transport system ATPase subunit
MNRELLAAFDGALQELLVLLPAVHEALAVERPLDAEQRWGLLRANADELAQRRLPVVTLLGPSGAGKSTIFRLLTGLDVPAGGAERPMSHNCMVAVPPDLSPEQLAATFPGMQLRALDDPAEIKRADLPRDTLFHREMPADVAVQGDFILADVPDFSTTCLENWEKAKLMLQRAEVVVFVVTRFSYADYQTVLYLARSCALAGHLAYVLTMADAESARRVWIDLVEQKVPEFALRRDIPAEDEQQPFAESRADHRTRAEFLAEADVYYSPYSEAPQLEDIRALRDGAPPLADFLRGRNIARLMLTKRANDLLQGLKLADEILATHAAQLADFRARRSAIFTNTEEDALDIVGQQLPLGEILEEVLAQAQRVLPVWRRAIATVSGPVWRGLRGGLAAIRDFFSKPEQARELRRDELELAALLDRASRLADRWRADHGTALDLTAERCSAALATLRQSAAPPPDHEWRQFAAEKARTWVREHPNRATLILNAGGAVALLAGGYATFDVLTTGGVVSLVLTKVGVFTSAAGGLAATGVLGSAINHLVARLGLTPVLLEFQAEWKRQRNRQLRAHLREHFARPLVLDAIDRRIATLERAPAAPCALAVAELRRLLSETQTGA